VKESMKAFDAVLPRLRAILRPQDHLVVFSIHGMGATNDVDRVGEAAVAHLGRAGRRSLALALDPVRTLRDALPQRAVRFVARSLPSQAYRWTYYHLQNARNDLARAKFVINPLDNLVYAHLGPRAADGPLTAKEALLADLQAEFQGIRTVDGSPIVEQAVRPGESLSGPRLGLLPGLIIKPIEQLIGPELIMANGARLQVPRHSSRDGEHTSEGFYIQTGPGVSAGSRGPTISGEQLAAFLLGPAGIPLAAAGAG